ncbi:MAG: hypothetical protein JSU00_06175 [Acidobacteria bacterium]|nr:hypothetical protein [Acidobacteriota bacterium]
MLNQPFFQITLPLMVTFIATIWIASWSQNKRFEDLLKRIDDLRDSLNHRIDDTNRRIDEVVKRLDGIGELLQNHDRRITTLEERSSPLARR